MKSKKYSKRMKSRIRSAFLRKSKTNRKTRSRSRSRGRSRGRTQRGGYSQYQNNFPMTPSYSVGGVLTPGEVGLANPPPYSVLPNTNNCTDNYNHFTGKGFASRGH